MRFGGEMAMTLDDLLWRRMRIGLTAGQGVESAPKIAQFLVESGHWDEARLTAEVNAYTRHIQELNAELKDGVFFDVMRLANRFKYSCQAIWTVV